MSSAPMPRFPTRTGGPWSWSDPADPTGIRGLGPGRKRPEAASDGQGLAFPGVTGNVDSNCRLSYFRRNASNHAPHGRFASQDGAPPPKGFSVPRQGRVARETFALAVGQRVWARSPIANARSLKGSIAMAIRQARQALILSAAMAALLSATPGIAQEAPTAPAGDTAPQVSGDMAPTMGSPEAGNAVTDEAPTVPTTDSAPAETTTAPAPSAPETAAESTTAEGAEQTAETDTVAPEADSAAETTIATEATPATDGATTLAETAAEELAPDLDAAAPAPAPEAGLAGAWARTQDFLVNGGPAIWAIAALSVVTVALILWKIWRLVLAGAWSRRSFPQGRRGLGKRRGRRRHGYDRGPQGRPLAPDPRRHARPPDPVGRGRPRGDQPRRPPPADRAGIGPARAGTDFDHRAPAGSSGHGDGHDLCLPGPAGSGQPGRSVDAGGWHLGGAADHRRRYGCGDPGLRRADLVRGGAGQPARRPGGYLRPDLRG